MPFMKTIVLKNTFDRKRAGQICRIHGGHYVIYAVSDSEEFANLIFNKRL